MPTSFSEHFREIARRFLLTAVVVDDELSVARGTPVHGGLTPPGRRERIDAPYRTVSVSDEDGGPIDYGSCRIVVYGKPGSGARDVNGVVPEASWRTDSSATSPTWSKGSCQAWFLRRLRRCGITSTACWSASGGTSTLLSSPTVPAYRSLPDPALPISETFSASCTLASAVRTMSNGRERSTGDWAGSNQVPPVPRSNLERTRTPARSRDGCPVGSFRLRAPVQGLAGIAAPTDLHAE